MNVTVVTDEGEEVVFSASRTPRDDSCYPQGGMRFALLSVEEEAAAKSLALRYLLATSRVVVNVENLKTDPILKEEIEKIAGTRIELSP